MSNLTLDKAKGIISFETTGLPPEEISRLMRILDKIIREGVLTIQASHMTINFDDLGEVSSIEILRRKRFPKVSLTPL